eukprot:COSAG01_NODE_931_length_12617_cov_20.567163_15_plen_50_part_01
MANFRFGTFCVCVIGFINGKFPIWVILGGVVFQCGSWISNYSNVGRFGYI